MTMTYNATQLPSNTTYQIRFNLGDTDMTSPQLQDEEIAWAYSVRGNTWGATAMCALALSAKYARLTQISADGVSQALNQKTEQFWKNVFKEYERKEVIYRAVPFVGGTSISDMFSTLSNTDRVPDIFRLGLNDNPPNSGIDPVNAPPSGSDDPFLTPF